MKVGDLVKLKHQGNGHPGTGLIVDNIPVECWPDRHREYLILWDMAEWAMSRWRERELTVIK